MCKTGTLTDKMGIVQTPSEKAINVNCTASNISNVSIRVKVYAVRDDLNEAKEGDTKYSLNIFLKMNVFWTGKVKYLS